MKMTINDAGELLCESLRQESVNRYAPWAPVRSTLLEALIEYIDDVTGEFYHDVILDPETCRGTFALRTVFEPALKIIREAGLTGTRSDYIACCLASADDYSQAEALFMHAKRLRTESIKWLKEKYQPKKGG